MARQFLEINVKSAFVKGITKILDTIVSSNLCQLSNLREAPMFTIVVMVSKQKSQNSLTALILIAMLQILIWGVLKIRKRFFNLAPYPDQLPNMRRQIYLEKILFLVSNPSS